MPLPKWPFLLADAAFLGTAWFLADQSPRPLDFNTALMIAGCVGAGGIAGLLPFLIDYGRKRDEVLDDRQRSLEALSRTLSAVAEQISVAANGFNDIAEIAQKNLKAAEHLPQRLQEKISEMEAKFAGVRDEDREELERELASLRSSESERLEATAEKIARASADLAKAEAFAQKHLSGSKTVLAELDQRLAALKTYISPKVERVAPNALSEPDPTPNPVSPPPDPEAIDVPPAPAGPDPIAGTPALSPADPAPKPAPRKRTPKKDPPDEHPGLVLAPDPLPPTAAPKSDPSLDFDDGPASDADQTDPSAPTVSITADGATRLIVTAYIGIGNRLFIRGDGPGLAWDQGIPLQFVSIGKWRWETTEATAPVRFKLFKNDKDECPLTPPPLAPGRQQELSASFQ